MNEEFGELLRKFQDIYLKNWIKSVNDDNNGVGFTFEKNVR